MKPSSPLFGILSRHTFAAIAAILLHYGITVDGGSTVSVLSGIIVWVFTWLASVITKVEMDEEDKQVTQKIAAALASQFVAALAGWLQVDAGTAADPVALSLFVGNLTLSRLRGHVPVSPAAMLLVLGSLCFVPACSVTSQQAFKDRLEGYAVAMGQAASVIALDGTLTALRGELSLLVARPVDADPMQQLLDQSRISAIQALIREGEARLKAMRKPGAKQPIEVNPSAQSSVLSDQSLKVRRIAIPKFAAPVVAHLRGEGKTTDGTDEEG